jgi:hypothetical protein
MIVHFVCFGFRWEYRCEVERTDMGGCVCGTIFVLDQIERNTFNTLAWLRDRLSLSEASVLSM